MRNYQTVKRLVALVLALMLVLTFAGCNNQPADKGGNNAAGNNAAGNNAAGNNPAGNSTTAGTNGATPSASGSNSTGKPLPTTKPTTILQQPASTAHRDPVKQPAGYTSALDTLVDVQYRGNVDRMEDTAPAKYWEYLLIEKKVDVEATKKAFAELWKKTDAVLTEDYGAGYTMSYVVVEEEKLDKEDLTELAKTIQTNWGISASSIAEGYEVEIDITAKGSKKTTTDEVDCIVVKIDGAWYCVNEYGSFFF